MKFFLLSDMTISPISGANFGQKNILGAIIGAGAGILGSVVGGFSNKSSTKNTNATNYRIAQEYNANQVRLAEMQNQWNIEQRDYMNAYNTPLAQMNRYKAAGINPYMAMSNISSGNQESVLEAVQPQQQTPPQMQAPDYSFIGDSVQRGIGAAASLADSALKNAQAKGQTIENLYNNDAIAHRLRDLIAKADTSETAARFAHDTYENNILLSDMNVQMQAQQIANARASQFNIEADTRMKNAMTGLSEKQRERLDFEINKMLPLQVENLRKQGKYLDAQAVQAYANAMLARSGVELNSAQAQEIRSCLPFKLAGLVADNDAKQLANTYAESSLVDRYLEQKGKAQKANMFSGTNSFSLGPLKVSKLSLQGAVGVSQSFADRTKHYMRGTSSRYDYNNRDFQQYIR